MTPDSSKSMAEVEAALLEVYTMEGALIWAEATHVSGPFKGRKPMDVCLTPEGRYEVWAWAQAMAGGVFL